MTTEKMGAPAARFTPGPWDVRGGQGVRRPHDIVSRDGAIVALTYWDSDLMEDSDEPEANARLLAAAPDLHEALRAIVALGALTADRDRAALEGMLANAFAIAEAALAKAGVATE